MSPPPTPDLRVFHVVEPWRYLTRAASVCGLTLVILFAAVPLRDRGVIVLVAMMMLLGLALSAAGMVSMRLEISEHTIVYYSVGYCVRSTWDNVLGYASRTMGIQSVEVLILREPGLEPSRWMQIGYRLLSVAAVVGLVAGRRFTFRALDRYANFIPVGLFADDWQASQLGRLIGGFAPQALTHQVD